MQGLLQRSNRSLNRQQGKPKVVIGATEYNVALNTLRIGEPIVFGGTDKTLDLTVSLNQADHPTQPSIGSTLVREDKNTRHRIVGVNSDPSGAAWQCDTIRDGSEFFWLTSTGDKFLTATGTRFRNQTST